MVLFEVCRRISIVMDWEMGSKLTSNVALLSALVKIKLVGRLGVGQDLVIGVHLGHRWFGDGGTRSRG